MSEDPFRPQEPAPDPDVASTTAERIVAWVRVHATPRRVIVASVFVIMWGAMLAAGEYMSYVGWALVGLGLIWEGVTWYAIGFTREREMTDDEMRQAAAVCANSALMAIVLAVIS